MIQLIVKSLEKMQPYVPLLQTLVWPTFISILLLIFRKHAGGIVEAIRHRIEKGSSVKAGPFEIGEDLKGLEYAKPEVKPPQLTVDKTAQNWDQERSKIYENNRGLFLTHVIAPSNKPKQKYDIYIYLIKHKSTDFSNVEFAEFFFGHMWGSKVYKEHLNQGVIGISTSAYGPFLCTCRVHMKDKTIIFLSRYIDFEMERLIEAQHLL
ncbi:MAG: hypothetical protein HY818_00050 [Acetobacterium woodii]|nr:hypothetical protein [Acetobacterium woodii]